MPKEIQDRPRPREIDLQNIRITFEELVNLLQRLNLDADTIRATSNGAEFVGLNDVRSAPARFSGEPFVQVKSNSENSEQASASIEFRTVTTTVSAGWWKGETHQNADDDALAIKIAEELRPFESILLKRLAAFMPTAQFLMMAGLACWLLSNLLYPEVLSFVGPLLMFVSFAAFLLATVLREFWDKKNPISFNPRDTFWQRHGEASVVGAIMTIITSLVVWYFTG